jgi:hypothetical protein
MEVYYIDDNKIFFLEMSMKIALLTPEYPHQNRYFGRY